MYSQLMMHGQENIKLLCITLTSGFCIKNDHQWKVTDVVMMTCVSERTYVFSPKDTPKIRNVHTLLRSKKLSPADDSALVYSRLYVKLKQDTQCMYKRNIGVAFVQPPLNWEKQ